LRQTHVARDQHRRHHERQEGRPLDQRPEDRDPDARVLRMADPRADAETWKATSAQSP
jgi:hypothetical protein